MKITLTRWGLAALMIGTLAGCGGGGGDGGGTTAAGGAAAGGSGATAAVTPPVGTPVDASALAADSTGFGALAPSGAVTGVSISSPPVVTFQVTDANGRGIKGLGFTSKSSTALRPGYSNLAFTLAKLVPGTNGSPSKWVSYIVTSNPTAATGEAGIVPGRPSSDNIGTLVDNGDGTYKYTFYRDITKVKDLVAAATLTAPNVAADLGDLTYDPTLLHRLVIQVGGNARGTGSNTADGSNSGVTAVPMATPKNIIFDWYPATGDVVGAAGEADGRDIVKVSNCFECHYKFTFHGGNRQDTKMCVTCHTDQRRYGRTEATITGTAFSGSTYLVDGRSVGNFPNLVHKIHMGKELKKTGYNFANVLFNEIGFPQDIRNCAKCHTNSTATPQGDNWKSVPSRLACGACHDGIDFATGKGTTLAGATTGHVGGAKSNDSQCILCHDSTTIPVYHATTVATTHGSALVDGVATFTYELSSVTLNASKQPVIKFRINKDGTAVTAFATPNTVVNTSGVTVIDPTYEPIAGFAGGPSLYVAYAVPQDGITAPADFNVYSSVALANLLAPATGTTVAKGTNINAGSLTYDVATGLWTATVTNSAPSSSAAALPITVPTSAVMVTGAIIGNFTQKNVTGYPYTAANVTVAPTSSASGGVVNKAQLKMLLASGITGNTARRAIVETARCNKCHEQLGTAPEFHGGARNDPSACAICHNPNRTSSGWSADSTSYIHSIHAASKRTVPYVWHAVSATDNYSEIAFPGILKNCETCHLPGTYDFSASASASALSNRLYRTAATGTLASTSTSAYRFAPASLVPQDVDYGSGFSYNVATGATTAAAGTTLVHSPIATACFSCHDSDLAVAHMRSNGGSIYAARTTALANSEQCTLCHLAGKVADIKAMHAK